MNERRLRAQVEALRVKLDFGVFAAFIREAAVRRWICESLKLSDAKFFAALVDLDNRRAALLPERLDTFAPHVSGTLRAICEFVLVQLRKRHPEAIVRAVMSVCWCQTGDGLATRGDGCQTEDGLATRDGLQEGTGARLRLPIPPEFQHVTKISPTRLDGYLRCPFTAYLHEKTVLGPRLWDPFATDLARWEFGNVVHAVLETFGGSEFRDSFDAAAIAAFLSSRVDAELADRFGDDVPDKVREQGAEAKRRLGDFAAVEAARRTAGWRIVAAEEKLEMKIFLTDAFETNASTSSASTGKGEPTLVYGKCDRIDFNEQTGEWLIVDYKTWDRVATPSESLQLPLYCAMLAAHAEGVFAAVKAESLSACYCILGDEETGCVYTSCVSHADVPRAIRLAEEGIRRLERGIFWPPASGCLWKREYGEWFSPSPEEAIDSAWLADQRLRVASATCRTSNRDADVSGDARNYAILCGKEKRMSDKISFEPPRGMRDFYPEDMVWRNRVFDAFRAAGESAGFEPYDSCVVESYELLARKAGEEVGDQIYHFFDKSERHIALRAEMTPTLARMVAQRQKELAFPLKWTTIAQCFRYERMTKGRKREHYQWNVDIIGEDSILAEVEVIGAAVDALRRMGLSTADFKVHVSSRKFLGSLLEQSGIAAEKHAQVFLALDKRGKMPDAEIAAMLKDGGLTESEVAATFKIMETTDYSASPELVELFRLAAIAGFADALAFDISVIRGLSYYTGIVFEAFDTKGEFRAIFGGGRYDNLLTTIGGEPTSAVGLGFGDVVVTELLKSRLGADAAKRAKGIAVGFMFPEQRDSALALAAKLRQQGERVDLALKAQKPKKFFAHADASGAAKAVFIGPDDVAKGVAKMKDLATRTETEAWL